MRFSKHQQGTQEWLEDRKKRVTASDASIINGTNTFGGNSPFKLWQQKLDILDKERTNFAMIEGNLLEEEALTRFNKDHSTSFVKPPGGYNDKNEWLMASLDGYDEKSDFILEIKCGAATYDKAKEEIIPPYYVDQIQHQLSVSGKKCCYYMAYRPDQEPIIMIINRDDEHIKKLFEKEKEFYDCLVNLIPPPLIEKEFVEIRDINAVELARKWRETKEKLKISQEMEKVAREALLDQTDDGNCIFPDVDVKVERRVKKGAVNYSAILKENDIDKEIVEKYRKPESSWLQPTIIKQA